MRATRREKGRWKANGLLRAVCAIAVFVGVPPVAKAQDAHVVLRILDGRNGKPLVNQRLLVFAGKTLEAVRQHENKFELVTGKNGMADLRIPSPEIKQIQVWVDFRVLCQSKPNTRSFSIAKILSKGVSTPNECGPQRVQPAPGQFIVFARPSHFWEKMRR